MKVDIGPYVSTWSTYRVYRKWLEWRYGEHILLIEDEDTDAYDFIIEKVLDAWQVVLDATINKFITWRGRREKVRIDPYDTWSMDHTLALIIVPMLKQLKVTNHGFQFTDPEDAPTIGKGDEVDFGHSDTKASERWDWVMDEMIWAFSQISREWDDGEETYYDKYQPDEEVSRVKVGDKYIETEEEARERGKFNPDKYKEYNDRIANGLRLFGKYYRGLWD
jgi:pyruvate/2-oxoacid:ferredoxin oxidoreductase alpha subunit